MYDLLSQDIKFAPGVGPKRKELLSKELGIETFGQLLEYYPYKYVDRRRIYRSNELLESMSFIQLKGRILSFETFDNGKRKKRLVGHFSDGYGIVDLVWFAGVQYALKQYNLDEEYIVFGRPSVFNGRFQITHPEIEPAATAQLSKMGMHPHYHTTERMKKSGMNSRTMEKIIRGVLDRIPAPMEETLPPYITGPLHLVSRDEAMRLIHHPEDSTQLDRAKLRLKFEELFYVQLNILRYASDQRRKYRGYIINRVGQHFNDFYALHLPFALTNAQKRVVREIHADMKSGRQMNRLLQGDVGSGKTLVALLSALLAIDNGYQVCLMAPTEILAEQHLTTLRDFLHDMDIRVELLTGIVKGKRRQEVLDGLLDGSVQILVGTHAVIEDNVQFLRLGLVVIDEQHRFGVAQRARLWGKSQNPPHVLVMTPPAASPSTPSTNTTTSLPASTKASAARYLKAGRCISSTPSSARARTSTCATLRTATHSCARCLPISASARCMAG